MFSGLSGPRCVAQKTALLLLVLFLGCAEAQSRNVRRSSSLFHVDKDIDQLSPRVALEVVDSTDLSFSMSVKQKAVGKKNKKTRTPKPSNLKPKSSSSNKKVTKSSASNKKFSHSKKTKKSETGGLECASSAPSSGGIRTSESPSVAPSSSTLMPSDIPSTLPSSLPTVYSDICEVQVLSLMIFKDEIWANEAVTNNNSTTYYQVSLFNERNFDYLGTVTSRIERWNSNDDFCWVSTTYNFVDSPDSAQFYDTQVFVQGTCHGRSNVVVGGTGRYAKLLYGTEELNDDGILETIKTRLVLCV